MVHLWQKMYRVHGLCIVTNSQDKPLFAVWSGQDTSFTITASALHGVDSIMGTAAKTMILSSCCRQHDMHTNLATAIVSFV